MNLSGGGWDDSANSRGLVFSAGDSSSYAKMMELIEKRGAQQASQSTFELLPPELRFSQKPEETDSFHAEISAKEEGIYLIRFAVGYHVGNERREISSDKAYGFATFDWFTRRR